jgi:uncharacterized RDD family membrane protein YckC
MQPSAPDTLFCAECGLPTPADELARFGTMLICPNCKERYAQKLREGVAPARAMVYGGFWIRFVAYLIDVIILAIVGSVVQIFFLGSLRNVVPVQPGVPPGPEVFGRMFGAIGLGWLISVAINALYEGLFVGKLGATPGKMALSLKVVRADSSPVTLGRAFGRYFGKYLSVFTLLIGFIIAGFDSQKRALHDMICDTRVIRSGE